MLRVDRISVHFNNVEVGIIAGFWYHYPDSCIMDGMNVVVHFEDVETFKQGEVEGSDLIELILNNQFYSEIVRKDWYYVCVTSQEAYLVRNNIRFIEAIKSITGFSRKYGREVAEILDKINVSTALRPLIYNTYRLSAEFPDYMHIHSDYDLQMSELNASFNYCRSRTTSFMYSNICDYILRNPQGVVFFESNKCAVARLNTDNDYIVTVYEYDKKFLKAIMLCSGG